MAKVSVIIPSRKELFLNQTIKDVLLNATGDIEVLPVLDGYEPPELIEDSRVKYVRLPNQVYTQKRHGINLAASLASGDYLMALDAHCLVASGFDTQLVHDHQPDWVQIPRRNRLDAENWCLQVQGDNRPPIDYEYIQFNPLLVPPNGLHGFRWDARTFARWDILIDDTFEFQGSCWFMTREWFNKCGFMQIDGYTGWGQEAEEISFTTWMNGGKVKTNKNTYYAHLHKGKKYGRMYHMSKTENQKSYEYSYDLWINKRKDFFISLIDKFMPLPNWPLNWKDKLWKH